MNGTSYEVMAERPQPEHPYVKCEDNERVKKEAYEFLAGTDADGVIVLRTQVDENDTTGQGMMMVTNLPTEHLFHLLAALLKEVMGAMQNGK